MTASNGFAFPERLILGHIWQLAQSGTLDVGALLCWMALILVLALLIRRIRRRTAASGYALVAVVIALALTVAFARWPDRVPPIDWDLGSGQINPPQVLSSEEIP